MSLAAAQPTTLELVRRWAVDWLASHDPAACSEILAEDYRLTIGAVALEGRDAYVEATVQQLERFPGLCLTVHDVLVEGDRAAVRFTEHGAATHREGRTAAWRGVCLFRVDAGRIVECWAEEDYASRSAQLSSGRPATPDPPAIAPWDTAADPPRNDVEQALRSWLRAPEVGGVLVDDGDPGGPMIGEVLPDVVVRSGDGAAFRGRTSVDGYDLGVAGLVRVDDRGGVRGHLVTDRAGWAAHRRKTSA